jgi:hypothetical protein
LGFGATFLIPLFLEIAQSRLLDNMHGGWHSDSTSNRSKVDSSKREAVRKSTIKDSPTQATDTVAASSSLKSPAVSDKNPAPPSGPVASSNTFKNYLLFAAYCLLAAAAGFRFINMLINNVVKEEQLNKLKSEKEEIKKEHEKRVKNSQISQQAEEEAVRKELTMQTMKRLKQQDINSSQEVSKFSIPVFPHLPPVKHPDDPQKGRFGGKAERNGRILKAEVIEADKRGFFQVKIWVESIDPENNPLKTDVIFYIHDSFSPSVFTYKPEEFTNGKAVEEDIISYGAFTVGIITDNGQTMLELDLAEQSTFPKEFRRR